MFNQYPYNIFNQEYMNRLAEQQREQKAREQSKKIYDMVDAFSKFIDAAKEIDPENRDLAMWLCIAEMQKKAQQDQMRWR